MPADPHPQPTPDRDREAARGTAAVIGGGPAGLMAAEVLAEAGIAVTVYDRMPSLGRKLLMAGRGGLNLTHSEPLDTFLGRYREARPFLERAVAAFPPEHLRAWSAALGQETTVGTSGRVFPAAWKASPLLRAWLRRLAGQGVSVALRHRWTGWGADGELVFDSPSGVHAARPEVTVLALGGASWPQLGSDGRWGEPLAEAGYAVVPFRPANAGVVVKWSPVFRQRAEGQPLKSVLVRHGTEAARGDIVVTAAGLEGGPLYALSASIRDAVAREGSREIAIALRPDLSADALASRLASRPGKQSLATHLRKHLRLTPAAISLLHEAVLPSGELLAARSPARLAALIQAVPIRIEGVASLERAISSAGGLAFASLDPTFMLATRPGVFAAGEMLDWEAPTGGYLLQACFATGRAAGQGALDWLRRRHFPAEPAGPA